MVRTGNERTGNSLLNLPVEAATTLNECTIAVLNSDGYAEAATKATGKIVAGCVQRRCDNSNGSDGDATVEVKRGTFVWKNDGSIETTDILKPCYISDEVTVTITAEGSSFAGIILEVEDDWVTVDMSTKYTETITVTQENAE